jgi:hypothetical protein
LIFERVIGLFGGLHNAVIGMEMQIGGKETSPHLFYLSFFVNQVGGERHQRKSYLSFQYFCLCSNWEFTALTCFQNLKKNLGKYKILKLMETDKITE